MPERRTATIYSAVVSCGSIMSNHMIRPERNRQFFYEPSGKESSEQKVLGFQDLINIRHPESFCIARQLAPRCTFLLYICSS
jgi:hypothetical protein